MTTQEKIRLQGELDRNASTGFSTPEASLLYLIFKEMQQHTIMLENINETLKKNKK